MKWIPYLCLLFALAFVDQEALAWLNLRVAKLELFLKSLPLRLRLMWDIYWMKHNMSKYLKMAEQIRKDLNETDTAGD